MVRITTQGVQRMMSLKVLRYHPTGIAMPMGAILHFPINLRNITLQASATLLKLGDLVGAFSYDINADLVFHEPSWFDQNYQHKCGAVLIKGHEINSVKATFGSNLKLYDGLFLDGVYFDSTGKKTLPIHLNTSKDVKLSCLMKASEFVSFGKVGNLISGAQGFVVF